MYLIRQGKWRVFSLSMFYLLCTVCLGLRIILNILSVEVAQNFDITLTLFPAIIKLDIGIVQVGVIIEIMIRVQESINTMSVLTGRQRQKAQNFINDVIASKKRADRWVHLMQVGLAFCVLCISVVALYEFIHKT